MSRRIASIVGGLLLLASSVSLQAAPVAAQTGDRDAAVALVSQSTWIAPDDNLVLRLELSGASSDDRLRVTFHERLAGRYRFVEALDGSLGRVVRTIADAPVAELDPDGDGRVDLALGIRSGSGDPTRLLIARDGLHPIGVELATADGTVLDGFVTFAARVDAVHQTLAVAVVQTLDAAPSLQADGTTQIAPSTREPLRRAATSMGADAATPVTFRLTAESIAALARSPEPLDAELLADLGSMLAGGNVAASPFVQIDPDALRAAGLVDLVGDQITRGSAVLEATFGQPPDTSTWIADPALGPAGLSSLVDAGITEVIVPYESLDPERRPEVLVEPFELRAADGQRALALATEPGLQSHVGSTGSGILDAQHLIADLAAIWFDRPSVARSTVVVLPADVSDRAFVEKVLEGIAAAPMLTGGTVPATIDASLPTQGSDPSNPDPTELVVLDLVTPPTAPSLSGYRSDLTRTRSHLASAATIFTGPDAPSSSEARLATSASAALDGPGRAAYLSSVRADIDAVLAQIAMPHQAAVTLPSRDGVIPITLVNGTGYPATVVLTFRSDKLEFPDGDRVELTLTEVHTPIEVPVRVRASGAFPLDMTMESPDGQIELIDSRYTVRSTAVSGLGIVLSGTAVLVLGGWWIRSARRARAAGRDQEPDEPAVGGEPLPH